ncbi:MAG TPA: hypothetical protein PKL13_01015 [bacterium]|nr:hypothetical protein [bacterium]
MARAAGIPPGGKEAIVGGLRESATEAKLQPIEPMAMITDIMGYILGFLGIIIFINIIFAGYQWIMAGGNEETISKAKTRIKNSIIGLIIIVSAYIITINIFIITRNAISQ